jgi:alkylmercury lyase
VSDTNDDCGDDDLLSDPKASAAAGTIGLRGFVALWNGERPAVADLTDDMVTVDALVVAGRLEVDDDARLVGVHGLVARPTAHRIEHDGGVVHTWCALDAIGIPAALAIDAVAATTCPTCGRSLRIELHAGVPVRDVADPRLWLAGGPCTHLVRDFCRYTNLYCNQEHLAARIPKGSPGRAVTVAEVAALGRQSWRDAAAALQQRTHGSK